MRAEGQQAVDAENRVFWDELCGSWRARSLGITEITVESLARFDAAYLDYYSYLGRYLEALPVEGRDVLEIGLGFGTVGQALAARGARYRGADIAAAPVAMMRDRLRWLGQPADHDIVEASALDLPWDADSFDLVVSIGCLHHTGDLPRSVAEAHRVLRPGGTGFVMLYNAHSFRQLVLVPRERRRAARESGGGDAGVRGMYDVNNKGEAAPHTDFVSRREARRLFGAFTDVSIQAQNSDPVVLPLGRRRVTIPRERLLRNLGRALGLDLYIRAHK